MTSLDHSSRDDTDSPTRGLMYAEDDGYSKIAWELARRSYYESDDAGTITAWLWVGPAKTPERVLLEAKAPNPTDALRGLAREVDRWAAA